MLMMMSMETNLIKRNGSSIQKRKSSFLTRIRDSLSHGSSYKSAAAEVPRDIICPQATATVCAPAVDTVSDVRVTIAIQKRVNFGERITVVGETDALGRWRPCDGVPLTWSDGDVWSAEISLQPGTHEFKVVTVKPDGKAEWETGSNRVIQVPTDAGALQAHCQWANTAHTTLVALPAVADMSRFNIGDANSCLEQPLLLRPVQVGQLGSNQPSLWPAQFTDAAVDLNGTPPVANQKPLPAAAAPAGCLEDGDDVSSGYFAYAASSSAGKPASGSSDQLQDEQQLIGHGSYCPLAAQNSSGDLSSYAYEYSNSSSSISNVQMPEAAFLQPQQLTSAAVKAAEAASVGDDSSSGYAPSADADDTSDLDAELWPAARQSTSFVRLQIPANDPAADILSPVSTTSTRPLRGAVSCSTLSFSSMEVSEALPDENISATPTAAYLLDAAAEAAAKSDSMGEMIAEEEGSLAELLTDPFAFEQLMAVEPDQLSTQHQQNLASTPQSAMAAAAQHGLDSVFATATAAAANCGESTEIMDAAAAVCELGSGVDPSQLLPSEETLPPSALLKFAQVSLTSDNIALSSETTADVNDEEQGLLDMSVSVSADGTDMRESSTNSSARSSFSGCSSLTKDQLPDLGLTVTVPTAADKAAAKAAEMSAAKAVAAAVKSKRRSAAGRGAVDDLLEPPIAQQGLRLLSAAHMIPHVDKVSTGGEDAFFVSPAGHGALGVSDGVSAWAEDGIDPGEYSRTLVQYCAEAFEERVMAATRAANRGSFIEKFDPRSILRYAQQCTCKPGSATVVLAALQPGGKLHVANLGDCGVKVVRDGKIVYETHPQQHDFNLPYQLSHPRLFPDTDTADSADRYAWDVEEGDVIIAASDGLFDNLWDEEMLQLLQQGLLGITPLDSASSLSSMDSLGRSAGKSLLRSRSFGAGLQSSSSGPVPALPAGAAAGTAGGSDVGGLSRSRSTSNLANWGAKQLRQWKGKSNKAPHGTAVNAVAEGCEDCSDCSDTTSSVDQAVVIISPAAQPKTTANCSAEDVTRAAELLAATAAAHAADKEFKSPWSVAAGKAYGLLARLFAKGGKMDDITCVVAVVRDAGKLCL